MNLENIRREFPVAKNRIFFDHARVAPLPKRVQEAINSFAEDACAFGNKNYPEWARHIESVRGSFARLIQAEPQEVAFVKNTTEGISIVANGLDWKQGDNVVIPNIEFPANVYPWLNLEPKGVETRFVEAVKGRVLFEDLVAKVDSRTRLLSISSVEYGTGFRNDLNRIGAFCKEKGILFCVDAIQSLGVLPMDVKRNHIDFLAADGHKWLLSVEGLGGFYISAKAMDQIRPPLVSWDSVIHPYDFKNYDLTLLPDAKRFEGGSLNTLGIYAFGAALSLFHEVGVENIESRILHLGDRILEGFNQRKIKVLNSTLPQERSGVISFLLDVDLQAFSDYMEKSEVSLTVREGATRVSPHFYNSEDEVDRFFDILDRFEKRV